LTVEGNNVIPDHLAIRGRIGGAMRGAWSVILLLCNGRIAGILDGVVDFRRDFAWRALFLVAPVAGAWP
jgi:hypothetical protein